jgi:hypothetical protein
MSFRVCPGSSAFAKPKIELLSCPHCGSDVEVWSDEADGQCPSCGKAVIRTATQSCIDWCRYAKQCLGDEKYKKYGEMKLSMRKEALLRAMEDQVGNDEQSRRVLRAVVAASGQMLCAEPSADPNVVIAAAVLRAAQSPQRPAPESAATRKFLAELNYPEGFIKEVDFILSLKTVDATSTLNARLCHDAVLLGRSRVESGAGASPVSPAALLTETGQHLAAEGACGATEV